MPSNTQTPNAREALSNAAAQATPTIENFYASVDKNTIAVDVVLAPAPELAPDGLIEATLKQWSTRVRVFPVKFAYFDRFTKAIEEATQTIFREATDENGKVTEEKLMLASSRIVMEILGKLSGLVEMSCVAWAGVEYEHPSSRHFSGLSLAQLPFHKQVECVTAWVRVSYMEGRFGPLVRLIEELLHQVTGKPTKLTLTGLQSLFSSGPVTRTTRSSTANGPAIRTEVGPSPSSVGTSAEPATPTPSS